MRFGTPDRHARHHRPLSRRRPGRPLPDQVPDQSRSPTPTPTPTHANADLERARRPAARRAALAALLAAVRELAPLRHPTRPRRTRDAARPLQRRKRTTGKTSASAAAASSSPASGPARPCAEHRADRATVVREALLERRDRRPRDRTDGRRPSLCRRRPAAVRVDRHQTRPAASTPGSSSPPSPNGNAGAPSTKPRRPHAACGQSFGNRTGALTDRLTTDALATDHTSASPITSPPLVAGPVVKGERSESAGRRSALLTTETGDQTITLGEAETPTT